MSYPDKPPLRTKVYVWVSLISIVAVMALVASFVMAWLLVGTARD